MSVGPEPSSNDRIDAILRGAPPVEGGTLNGWVTFCEWTKPNGERILALLGKPEDNLTQLKGYVHSGLMGWFGRNTTTPWCRTSPVPPGDPRQASGPPRIRRRMMRGGPRGCLAPCSHRSRTHRARGHEHEPASEEYADEHHFSARRPPVVETRLGIRYTHA